MNRKTPTRTTVSHEELAQAIQAFQAQGGLIAQLPAEKVIPSRVVGRRWSRYEEILNTDGGATEDSRG